MILPRRLISTSLTIAVVASLLIGGAFAAPAQADTPVSGTWSGPVAQAGSQPYSVRIRVKKRLREGRPAAKISYPGLGCRGNLVFLRKAGKRFIFRERLTVQRTCLDRGKVVLVRKGATLRYRWSGSGERAAAVLRR